VSTSLDRRGIVAAVLAYSTWGFFPLYWNLLRDVSALETMSHRVIWSFVFYTVLALVQGKQIADFASYFRNPETRKPITYAAILIACNWLLYVWGVTHGHVMETSLGYFMTPLFNVTIGAMVFKERLAPLQKLSLFFAVIGIVWLTYDFGRLPWVALALALSFSSYGYFKKTVQGHATVISMVETLILLPLALIGAMTIRLMASSSGITSLESSSRSLIMSPEILTSFQWILLIGGGAVTGIPLLFFAVAAQRLPFSTLGFFQYIAPSIQFLSAVFFFHEPFDHSRLIGFSSIWLALGIFILHLRFTPKAADLTWSAARVHKD
jgi:chloramphenicol-sensitive protein RarD